MGAALSPWWFCRLGAATPTRRGQLRALTPQLAELIELLKRENPHRTGATLLRELALVSTGGSVSPSTLYRFLKQRGLTKRQLLATPARGILITHTPCQPEWRGEIEGSGRERFLADLDPQRTLPQPELNERLGAWIEQAYDAPEHSGFPWRTLMSSPGPIRPRWTNPVLWRRPASEKRTEQQNLQLEEKSGTVALFRYGLIAPLVLEYPLPAGELTRRAREIAARVYDIPYSKRTSVSIDSLLNWVLRYREGGFEALIRKSRNDRRQFSSITPVIADMIERLKRENPNLTGTALLHELRLASPHDSSGVSAATLYRFLKQRGLSVRHLTVDAPLKPLKKDWRIDFICNEDRELLTEWRRSKDKDLWQKAVTVLENANLPPEDIAKKVERPLSCIQQWIRAFKCGGIKALNPARKPRVIAAERRATLDQKRRRILEILHASPRFYAINRSNWNRRSIALAYRQQHNEAISTSTVGRFVKQSGYTMKKARKVLCSPDPEYREKVDFVLHTLQNLEPLDLFFFVDELGPMQVKQYGGRTFVPKNKPYTFPQQQKSRGVINMAGALNAVTPAARESGVEPSPKLFPTIAIHPHWVVFSRQGRIFPWGKYIFVLSLAAAEYGTKSVNSYVERRRNHADRAALLSRTAQV